MTSWTDGLGNSISYSYDDENRVKQIDHSGIQTEIFGRDGVGNVLSYNSNLESHIPQELSSLADIL